MEAVLDVLGLDSVGVLLLDRLQIRLSSNCRSQGERWDDEFDNEQLVLVLVVCKSCSRRKAEILFSLLGGLRPFMAEPLRMSGETRSSKLTHVGSSVVKLLN